MDKKRMFDQREPTWCGQNSTLSDNMQCIFDQVVLIQDISSSMDYLLEIRHGTLDYSIDQETTLFDNRLSIAKSTENCADYGREQKLSQISQRASTCIGSSIRARSSNHLCSHGWDWIIRSECEKCVHFWNEGVFVYEGCSIREVLLY